MAKKQSHKESIIDQFTRQAVPFAQKPELSQKEALDLLIEATAVSGTDTVLDVACGPGIVACAFAEKGHHVTGIDITPAMIEQAKKRQTEKGLTNLSWLIGDISPLPFPDSSFSMVVTRFSFHHFIHPKAVLKEMVRVCKSGGTVMVADIALPPEKAAAFNVVEKMKDPSHTRALTEREFIETAREQGIQDIRTKFFKVEMELEAQLSASFPNPGDDEKIRRILRDDLGKDDIGYGAHLVGDAIHIAYPIMALVGKKL